MASLASDGSEIRSVEARIYRCDLDRSFGYSRGWISFRESAVARLVTADGTVGWGEAYAPAQPAAAAIDVIGRHFAGRSVFERVPIARATADRVRDFPERAPLAAALSAVAIAACDAAAKLLRVPVRALLGGARNPPLRPYASGLWFEPAEDATAHYADQTRALLDQGFDAIKAKIGKGPDADLRAIERVLGAAGEAAVMVDANQAYDAADAEAIRRGIADSPLVWLEEPLPPDRLDDYAALRARSTVPIAGGETIASVRDARAWLSAGASDVVQPDVCLAGGLDEAGVISAVAAASGAVVAPHCYGLGIGLAASLHWAALIAGDGVDGEPVWVEIDTSPNPARDALLDGCEWFGDDGVRVSLPTGPGLGVDPERIERYRAR